MSKNNNVKIPLEQRPLWQRINWVQSNLLLTVHVLALIGLIHVEVNIRTALFALVYATITGLGITAGYHRYFSHRAFKATKLYQLFIMLAASGGSQGTILRWCRDHRSHHRFTDTPKDPHSAKEGLFWSHIGWLIFKKDSSKLGSVSVEDLEANPIIRFQDKFFPVIMLSMAFGVPTLISGLFWDDWYGGFFHAGALRLTFTLHSTFLVNSMAHYSGDSTFDDKLTPKDSALLGILTLGEGFHNFHHEFPQDYRNGYRFYHFDITKWFIYSCYLLGLVYDLKTFPDNEIQKGSFLMKEKSLGKLRTTINWGTPIEDLPNYTMEDFVYQCKENGKSWILIEKVILDITNFIDEHPGGVNYIQSQIGKDATKVFGGQIYDHSNAARNLMASMRVGKIE